MIRLCGSVAAASSKDSMTTSFRCGRIVVLLITTGSNSGGGGNKEYFAASWWSFCVRRGWYMVWYHVLQYCWWWRWWRWYSTTFGLLARRSMLQDRISMMKAGGCGCPGCVSMWWCLYGMYLFAMIPRVLLLLF